MVKIEWDIKLGFKDVLIRPKRSQLRSRKDVELIRTYKFLHSKKTWSGIPVVAANMDTTGTFEMARSFAKNKCMVAIHKHYSLEEWDNFITSELKNDPSGALFNFIAVSAGTSDRDFNKITKLLSTYKVLQFICLDIANGYSEHFAHCIQKVRKSFPDHIIMAGNVVTQEMTEQLLLSGADIVKVGIGPGSVCTTRKKTGVGYPQLSAVLECADAAHGLGGMIIADGGCTMPGDFSKAFGAGADFVMAGGMFSGFDESGGKLVTDQHTGKKYKQFYGMSSAVAMKKHSGQVANYRASEGKCVLVPYKGDVVNNCLLPLLGGVRSTCTYVGAKSLKELSKRTTFIRVQQHHNIVFGDEKHNDSPLLTNDKKKESALDKYPIFDPSNQSMSNLKVQKEALLDFLNKVDDDSDSKDNNDKNEKAVTTKSSSNVDLFSIMSKEMKSEYFEWVYKKEQQKIKEQNEKVLKK